MPAAALQRAGAAHEHARAARGHHAGRSSRRRPSAATRSSSAAVRPSCWASGRAPCTSSCTRRSGCARALPAVARRGTAQGRERGATRRGRGARAVQVDRCGRADYIRRPVRADWRDPDNYDLSLDTGRLGVERAVELIESTWRGTGLPPRDRRATTRAPGGTGAGATFVAPARRAEPPSATTTSGCSAAGMGISLVGTWMQSVAQAWLVLRADQRPARAGHRRAPRSSAGARPGPVRRRHCRRGQQTCCAGRHPALGGC